jgi:RsiW-degrading membrane proteinase PrsW (M82 family)
LTVLFTIALAPVFIIAFYIYFRDKYEKEPWDLLLKAMLSGALITIPVIVAERILSAPGELFPSKVKAAWDAFMVAALCEEAFKFAALYLLIWKNKAFNEKFDGIVYATFISLGFAAVENVLYIMDSGVTTGFTRAFTAVPAHALFGVSMGFFFGLAKFYPKKRTSYLYFSFLLPFILHGVYDFILMVEINLLLLLFVPFIIFMWITGFKKMNKLNKSSIYNSDLNIGIDFRKVKEFGDRTNTDNV